MGARTTAKARRAGEPKKKPLIALLVVVSIATHARTQTAPFRARVREAPSWNRIELDDGRALRLSGLSLPAAAVCPADADAKLSEFVQQRLLGRSVWIIPEEGNEDGSGGDVVALVRDDRDGISVNEAALAAGLAVLRCSTPEVRELERLRAAAQRAQREGRGWFAPSAERASEPPYLNGAVVGLHYQEPDRDYHWQIDELAAAGFRHVCFLFSAFLADVRASRIDRDHPRCVRDERLLETIAYAKQKGMSVMLLPIVLLLRAAKDEWRGKLQPSDPEAFWRSYEDLLCHYLDLAEASGADIVSIGSELGSLESDTLRWNRLIAHARARFRGWLCYSANWDHVHVPRFFGQLDLVGLTAYFSLTGENDPSPEALARGWREIGARLSKSVGMLGKPVIFTELGYASQDGINRDPWNYVMNEERLDLEEQAQCFAAFLSVAPSLPFLGGAYFYDYFDEGGPRDPSYSPRGKPAWREWLRWAAYRPPDK